ARHAGCQESCTHRGRPRERRDRQALSAGRSSRVAVAGESGFRADRDRFAQGVADDRRHRRRRRQARDGVVMSAGIEALTGPHLWRGRAGCPAHDVRSTGFEALDRALGGGWPWGAVVEILVERYGCGELGLLMPVLESLSASDDDPAPGFFVFVAPPWVPYPPAMIRFGIDVGRVLVVRAD